ncbi:dienelactone hydrolase [Burkholderia sp. Ac-20353]|nr:dienelactone hydrolase [Burkholderia sp. Ac-20353]
MRRVMAAVLFVALAVSASAQSSHFNAGVTRLTVPDETAPIDTLVFYPTNAPEVPWQAGPLVVEASRNATLAANQRFPTVLLSHGRRGGPLSHRDLAVALARAGFIVIAPTHIGDASGFPLAQSQAQVLIDRPRQAEEALDAVLSSARFARSVDASRIGMIGYSAGGYTALTLAGAKPDFEHAIAVCAHLDDPGSCPPSGAKENMAGSTSNASFLSPKLATWRPPVDLRLKALVLMDPLAVMFDSSSLAPIHVPMLLYRPQSDAYLNATWNVLAVASGFPVPPKLVVVPGSHFVFIDSCPPQIAAAERLICQDEPGVDRSSIHRQIETQVIAFLQANL